MTLGGLYSRNPHSIPESLTAIPSVGSPGSAGPSPHPNSTLSQPTSIPPADQVTNKTPVFISYDTFLTFVFGIIFLAFSRYIAYTTNIGFKYSTINTIK